MPELPEVETVRLLLERTIGTQAKLTHITLKRKNLRFAFPESFAEKLLDAHIVKFERHGKYLLLHLNQGLTWLVHFGMSGSFRFDSIHKAHDHALFAFDSFDDGISLIYHDPRRFGFMDIFTTSEQQQNRFLNALGQDPLKSRLHPESCYQIGQKSQSSIKALLMNQRFIAGLGNIYCNEALWLAQIHPARQANTLSLKQWGKLTDAIAKTVRKAVKAGGSSFSDFSHPTGAMGYFQHQWQIYDRDGQTCHRCHESTITRIIQNGRASFFCIGCTPC